MTRDVTHFGKKCKDAGDPSDVDITAIVILDFLPYHAASGLGIAFAMDLQMIAATANCTLANEAFTYENLKDDIIIGGKLKRQGPYYAVPQEAGVGVSLDRTKLKKYHDAYMKIKALKSDR